METTNFEQKLQNFIVVLEIHFCFIETTKICGFPNFLFFLLKKLLYVREKFYTQHQNVESK